jgi:hypothetical protein
MFKLMLIDMFEMKMLLFFSPDPLPLSIIYYGLGYSGVCDGDVPIMASCVLCVIFYSCVKSRLSRSLKWGDLICC